LLFGYWDVRKASSNVASFQPLAFFRFEARLASYAGFARKVATINSSGTIAASATLLLKP